MAVEYGFYSSKDGDRQYDALQIGELMNGLITDGVYANVGSRFYVKPVNKTSVNVSAGRAWFHNTFVKNSSNMLLTFPENLNNFYIVIEINQNKRENSIKFSQNVTKTEQIKQYPIAYISRKSNLEIDASCITNKVGTSECPVVSGIQSVIPIEEIVSQWNAEWNDIKEGYDEDFKELINKVIIENEKTVRKFLEEETNEVLYRFEKLYEEIENKYKNLSKNYISVEVGLEDSDGDSIKDNNDEPISGEFQFVIR